MKLIPYSRQTIDKNDINEVVKTLKSDFLTQGPKINLLEKKFKKIVNSNYCTAVNSATSALHVACIALGLKKGDYLWTVPNSFVSSSNCGLLVGAKVDFVDINFSTGNIDIQALERKLKNTPKKKLPKIIIPVHYGGLPPELDKIFVLSKKYNFKILEDASHAIGSSYRGNKIGNCKWSDITIFSLHPVKIITAGEGGIASTNNKALDKKMKMLRNHGITKEKKFFEKKNKYKWYFEQQFLGLNYRMTDISAALCISQLKKARSFVIKRNKIANLYKKLLDKKHLDLPESNKFSFSSFHLFVIRIKNKYSRERLFNFLRKKKILVNLHYIPIHLHPYYKRLGFKKGQFLQSEKHAERAISLHIFPSLKIKQVKLVSNYINYFLNKNEK